MVGSVRYQASFDAAAVQLSMEAQRVYSLEQWFPTFFGLGPLLFCWRASGVKKEFLNLADTIYVKK